MSPRDTDRVIESRTMESDLGPVDAPPSLEEVQQAAERWVQVRNDGWNNFTEKEARIAKLAFLAGCNWRDLR